MWRRKPYVQVDTDAACINLPLSWLPSCSGSAQQYIGIFNHAGDGLSTIKYHEGFMGQRIGPITCLTFHPYKVQPLCVVITCIFSLLVRIGNVHLVLSLKKSLYTAPPLCHGSIQHDFGYNTVKIWIPNFFSQNHRRAWQTWEIRLFSPRSSCYNQNIQFSWKNRCDKRPGD